MTAHRYSAGIYEQSESGWRLVEWSRHSRADLAQTAARRYAACRQAPTGGVYSWSAWWRDGDVIEVEVRANEVQA